MYQALYRKWRPRTFSDVMGQEHITRTLQNQVMSGRLSHAYLFTGTRGTGKTSCAKILARAVNCQHPVNGDPCNQCPACLGIENGSILDVVELDAASNNGVDQVRALRDEAIYSPTAVEKRVYIVDEVHMLSTAAFNALLKILEEPPEHLMFILATTEPQKVPATILSRCQRFSFRRLGPEVIRRRLEDVSRAESIDLTPDGAALLARLADGALRDGLSLLDQCAAVSKTVDRDAVLDTLGLAGNLRTARLMNEIRRQNTAAALEQLSQIYDAGKDMASLLGELSALARDLLIRKTASNGGVALLAGGYDEATLKTLSDGLPPERLLLILNTLQAAMEELRQSQDRRTTVELCILRLCSPQLDTSPAALAARIAALEERMGFVPETAAAEIPSSEESASVPAPSQMDSPPWDELSPPSGDGDAPDKPDPPLSRQSSQKAASPADGGIWPAIAERLRASAPPMARAFLTNPDQTSGVLTEGRLTLSVTDDFVRHAVERQEVLSTVAAAAKEVTGEELQVVVRTGVPAPAAAVDPLAQLEDSFRKFGFQVK